MLKYVEEEKHMTSHNSPRRLAIVTGASRRRGIGTAVCLALAQTGIDIFFTHWSPYDSRSALGSGRERTNPTTKAGASNGRSLRTPHDRSGHS